MKSGLFIILISFLLGCSGAGGHPLEAKNACVEKKLAALRETPAYKAVMAAFADTFAILKSNPANFGKPEYSECRTDDALFLNDAEDKCILLVSIRYTDGLSYGGSRVVHGIRGPQGWQFTVGKEFTYNNAHYDKYGPNDFSHINMLGRFAVIEAGSPRGFGCNIDADYWFKSPSGK